MLVDQVFFVLRNISQILGRVSSINLATLDNSTFLDNSSRSDNSVRLNSYSSFNPGIDSNIGERFHSALIQFRASPDVRVVSNLNRLAI